MSHEPTAFNDPPGTGLDIRELIGALLEGWLVFVVFLAGALCAGGYYLFVTPEWYQTDATVQIENKSNTARIAFANVSDAVSADAPIRAEIEILQSRRVLGEVVDSLSLDIQVNATYLPLIGAGMARNHRGKAFGTAPLLLRPLLSNKYSWGNEVVDVPRLDISEDSGTRAFKLISEGDGAYSLFTTDGHMLGQGQAGEAFSASLPNAEGASVSVFVRALSAPQGREFSLFKRPRLAAINALQNRLGVREVESSRYYFGAESGIIRLSYGGVDRKEIVRVLNAILSTYQTQNLERNSAEASKTLEFLREQLPRLKEQVESAEAKLNKYKIDQGSADLTLEATSLLERNVDLEAQRQTLMQQRKEARLDYTENHPVVISLDSKVAQVDAEIEKLGEKIRKLPEVQQESLRLSRDLTVNTELYVALLNRAQELEVVKNGTIGSVNVIDRPAPPLGPSSPVRSRVWGLCLLLGLFASVAWIWIRYLLSDGVSDPKQIEQEIGLPVYGVVPFSHEIKKLSKVSSSKKESRDFLLSQVDPTGHAAEAVRSIRTRLHFAAMDAKNNLIMLTGPEPELGKSFVSANLAVSLAQAGQRVLLVDADLRRGRLNRSFGLEREGGLSELLLGEISLEDAVKDTKIERLSILPTGSLPPNPAELLMTDRLVEALEGFRSSYDHVIIDTPPSLGLTDASIIGRLCSVTLLVLKAGKHSPRMITDSVARLRSAGVDVRGAILNQVGVHGVGRYAYGYKYGYYQYSYEADRKS